MLDVFRRHNRKAASLDLAAAARVLASRSDGEEGNDVAHETLMEVIHALGSVATAPGSGVAVVIALAAACAAKVGAR